MNLTATAAVMCQGEFSATVVQGVVETMCAHIKPSSGTINLAGTDSRTGYDLRKRKACAQEIKLENFQAACDIHNAIVIQVEARIIPDECPRSPHYTAL